MTSQSMPLSDYSTKRKRRAAVEYIIKQLELIKAHEEKYRDNMPENLQNSAAYEDAEEYIDYLDEVLSVLIPF